MKRYMYKTMLLLIVLLSTAVVNATVTYVLRMDRVNTGGFGSIYYMRSTYENGDVEHFMNCQDPGDRQCCWPFIPVIRKKEILYSFDDIRDYVLEEIARQNLRGEILWKDAVPVRWSVKDGKECTISIDSDDDMDED